MLDGYSFGLVLSRTYCQERLQHAVRGHIVRVCVADVAPDLLEIQNIHECRGFVTQGHLSVCVRASLRRYKTGECFWVLHVTTRSVFVATIVHRAIHRVESMHRNAKRQCNVLPLRGMVSGVALTPSYPY
jgi:hypothetical protein